MSSAIAELVAPGGAAVAVGAGDGTVRFHHRSVCRAVDEIVAVARERVTRHLTPEERRRFALSD